jgi:mono/diheme cytochrome c family protein
MPVPGTVARGHLNEDEAFSYGIVNNQYVGRNPLPITMDLVKLGQVRFNTYCSPCHDRAGTGRGSVPSKALWLPTSLHEDRVRQMNDGEIFNIISYGRRSMPPYRFQVVERDRWAIVAYVRALQRTTGTVDDVPENVRGGLK